MERAFDPFAPQPDPSAAADSTAADGEHAAPVDPSAPPPEAMAEPPASEEEAQTPETPPEPDPQMVQLQQQYEAQLARERARAQQSEQIIARYNQELERQMQRAQSAREEQVWQAVEEGNLSVADAKNILRQSHQAQIAQRDQQLQQVQYQQYANLVHAATQTWSDQWAQYYQLPPEDVQSLRQLGSANPDAVPVEAQRLRRWHDERVALQSQIQQLQRSQQAGARAQSGVDRIGGQGGQGGGTYAPGSPEHLLALVGDDPFFGGARGQ